MKEAESDSFGACLKRYREARGLSQEELAERAGVHPNTISAIERGEHLPRKSTVELLIKALDLSEQEAEYLRKLWFRDLLRRRRRTTSPVFWFNVPLPAPGQLYGRSREQRVLLRRAAMKGGCTSIVGPRRIGKTWLLSYLSQMVKEERGSRFRIGFLDAALPGCETAEEFTACAIRELHGSPDSFEARRGLKSLESLVRTITSKGQTPILCIDGFGRFGNRAAFDLSFFTELRAITQLGLGLATASRHTLFEIIGDYGDTSGLFNVFRQCKLGVFTLQEAETFIDAKGAEAGFSLEEQDVLRRYGRCGDGFFPLRLQLAGELLLEDKQLAASEDPDAYRPDDPHYWQEFEQDFQASYREVMHGEAPC